MITQIIGSPIDIDQQVKSHEPNATGYITIRKITKNHGPLIKLLIDIFGISSTPDEKTLRKLPAKSIDEDLRFKRQTTGIIPSYNFCKELLKTIQKSFFKYFYFRVSPPIQPS